MPLSATKRYSPAPAMPAAPSENRIAQHARHDRPARRRGASRQISVPTGIAATLGGFVQMSVGVAVTVFVYASITLTLLP